MKSILVGLCVAGAALVGTAMAAATAETAAAESATTVAHWQPQKLNFNYSGFTTLYTCDGLEDKVRDILETFGARKGIKVRATGCSEGQNRPSKFAWVTAEFSSLAPVASEPTAAVAASDTAKSEPVKVEWAKVRLAPHRPSYMGDGECELVDQMRDVLQKGFALRNASYRTSCIPHSVSIADYDVTAEVMKASR